MPGAVCINWSGMYNPYQLIRMSGAVITCELQGGSLQDNVPSCNTQAQTHSLTALVILGLRSFASLSLC